MANVSANVIEPLVLREGAMPAVVADDEEAPHEETCEEKGGGREEGRKGEKR